MLSSLPTRSSTLLTATVVILGAACSSKEAEQRPAVESAASAPATNRSTDTTARDTMANPAATSAESADSATALAPQPAQASSVGTAKRTKPPVKPSIDPGRKAPPSPKPTATPPAADSAATPVGSSAAARADSPSTQSAQGQSLKWDAGSKTATFQLIGGPSGFQFNGYSSGGATLTLPPNVNVVMNFINKDGTPHSAEVIPGEGALPNQAVDAAIPRAYTNQVLQGLPQEGTDVMKFTTPASGTFRIFCGVPGHGLSGMWIWMKIDPSAKSPSFGSTKS